MWRESSGGAFRPNRTSCWDCLTRLLLRRFVLVRNSLFFITFNFLCFMLLLCIYMYMNETGDDHTKESFHPTNPKNKVPAPVSFNEHLAREQEKWIHQVGPVDACTGLVKPDIPLETFDWKSLGNSSRETYIFSAYLDTRNGQPTIKLIGVNNDFGLYDDPGRPRHRVKYCQVWYKHHASPDIVWARYDIVPETHDLQ